MGASRGARALLKKRGKKEEKGKEGRKREREEKRRREERKRKKGFVGWKLGLLEGPGPPFPPEKRKKQKKIGWEREEKHKR